MSTKFETTTRFTCDRCQKVATFKTSRTVMPVGWGIVTTKDRHGNIARQSFDLCDVCRDSLDAWMCNQAEIR